MTNPLIIHAALHQQNNMIPGIDALQMRGHQIRGVQNLIAVMNQLIDHELDNLPPGVARVNPLQRHQPTDLFRRLGEAIGEASRANFGADLVNTIYGWYCPDHDTLISSYDVQIDADGHPRAHCWNNTDGTTHIMRPEARPMPEGSEPEQVEAPLTIDSRVQLTHFRDADRQRTHGAWQEGAFGRVIDLRDANPNDTPPDRLIRVRLDNGNRLWLFRDELRIPPTPTDFAVGTRVRLTRAIEDEYDIEGLDEGLRGTIAAQDNTFGDPGWAIEFDGWGQYTLPQHELELII